MEKKKLHARQSNILSKELPITITLRQGRIVLLARLKMIRKITFFLSVVLFSLSVVLFSFLSYFSVVLRSSHSYLFSESYTARFLSLVLFFRVVLRFYLSRTFFPLNRTGICKNRLNRYRRRFFLTRQKINLFKLFITITSNTL